MLFYHVYILFKILNTSQRSSFGPPQQTRHIEPILGQCWTNLENKLQQVIFYFDQRVWFGLQADLGDKRCPSKRYLGPFTLTSFVAH